MKWVRIVPVVARTWILGDRGVAHPEVLVLVLDRVRVLDAHPRVVGYLGDRPGHSGVHAGGETKTGPHR